MEVIRIADYTEDEKLQIVKTHLMQKQFETNGLRKDELVITDDAVRDLVREPVTARLPVLGPVVLDLGVYDRLLAAPHA